MGLVAAGLVLGEAVWIFIVALTRDVILPLMAMALGEDTTSPLSLGKQEFNIPDLFTAVLELCLAALFAILLYAWMQKKPKPVKVKSLNLVQASSQGPHVSFVPQATAAFKAAGATQKAAAPVLSATATSSPPPIAPDRSPAPDLVAPQTVSPAKAQVAAAPPLATVPVNSQAPAATAPAKAKLTKPKEPKQVYYNLVGERITPPDDDDNG